MKTEAGIPQGDTLDTPLGIVAALGELGEGALITERGLARLLECHRVTVKRAVKKGHLPMPVRLMGKPTWTVGFILQHIEKRLEAAAREEQNLTDRIEKLRP